MRTVRSALGAYTRVWLCAMPLFFLPSTELGAQALLRSDLVSGVSHQFRNIQHPPDRWTLKEELRIGAQDGPDALTRISTLATDSAGNIYVVQPLDAVVRMYDSAGKRVATLGRRGDGPEEFRIPLHAGWIRDTLWVVDLSGQRVTMWHRGVAAGGFRFTAPRQGPQFNPVSPIAVLHDGALLFGAVPTADAGGRAATYGAALRADRDGSSPLQVAALRFTSRPAVESQHGSRLVLSYQPFDDRTLIRVSPDGRLIVVVDRTAAAGSGRGEFAVVALSARGDTLFHKSFDYRPVRLTRDIVEKVTDLPDERFAERFPSREAALRAVRSALVVPEYLPPVSELAVGRDHSIWLRREDVGSGTVEWLVLDKRGTAVGRLDARRGTKILQADAEHVWAVEEDDLGVSYVVRYRILK